MAFDSNLFHSFPVTPSFAKLRQGGEFRLILFSSFAANCPARSGSLMFTRNECRRSFEGDRNAEQTPSIVRREVWPKVCPQEKRSTCECAREKSENIVSQ